MLRRFYALITALTLLASLATAQVVNIPDPNLERRIRRDLEIPNNLPVTRADMLGLVNVFWSDENISDLTSLEHATNLELVLLGGNPIADLSILGSLPKLDTLHIAGIHTSNLDWLANVKTLRDLFAIHCGIEDISGLAGLTNLVSLDLAVSRIADISAIANLINLERLHIEINQISDISPLASLAWLKELHIHRNRIVDASPLAGLVRLTELRIHGNLIVDFSTIDGLALDSLIRDEECDIPGLPVQERLHSRSLPSVFLPWDDGILNRGGEWWNPTIPYVDRIAVHDLWWRGPGGHFDIPLKLTTEGYKFIGEMSQAIAKREELLAKNPNMLFLVDLRQDYAPLDRFGEDWFGWIRDENGNPALVNENDPNSQYLIDYRRQDVQNVIVRRAAAVAQCGLYDGIMFDAWGHGDTRPLNERYSLLGRIRENVPDDFLILFNTNHWYIPALVPHINGAFMETFPHVREDGYTRERIIEIETNLIKYEETVREPKINCLRGFGVGAEPPDSQNNRRWMRLFTTMSLTCSDGYALYSLGTINGERQFSKHIWHPFWGADLGQPVGDTVQRYRDVEGLYIREFANGWAVYNRSGEARVVSLPEQVQSVRSGLENTSYAVPDLDGDIFLRVEVSVPADVNGDGVVNILDLVIVAQSLGTGENDVNGDGVTNVFDLVIVAEAFNQ